VGDLEERREGLGLGHRLKRMDLLFIETSGKEDRVGIWAVSQSQDIEGVPIR
jgi:hypothetical protein